MDRYSPGLLCIVGAGLAIAGTGCRDDCDRAVERLQRIEAARPRPAMPSGRGLNPLLELSPAERANLTLEQCRHGEHAAYDPVLACARTADSDEAAAACIDRIVHDVVPGSSSETTPKPVVHEPGSP